MGHDFIFRSFRNVLLDPVDGRGSGGSGTPSGGVPGQHQSGQGGQQGAGQFGQRQGGTADQGAGAQGQGQQAASRFRLNDDAEVEDPETGEAMTFRDYKRKYGANLRNQFVEQLRTTAQALRPAQGNAGHRTQPQQPQQQAPQIDIDAIRDQPLIDGRTVAQLYQQGVQPMQQYVQQLGQVIKQQGQVIQQLQQGQGTVQERISREDFDRNLDRTITEQLGEEYDPKDTTLRELAETLYLSYDTSDKNLPKEFPGIFKKFVAGVEKWVRERDKARMEKAKNKPRVPITRRGGNATPKGNAQYKFQNPSELADMLFNEPANT